MRHSKYWMGGGGGGGGETGQQGGLGMSIVLGIDSKKLGFRKFVYVIVT